METALRNRGKYTSQPVIGRNRAGAYACLVVPVVSVDPGICPVGEEHAGGMTACPIASRADETSHHRFHAIGSNDEFSRHVTLPPMTILEPYTAHTIVVRAEEA